MGAPGLSPPNFDREGLNSCVAGREIHARFLSQQQLGKCTRFSLVSEQTAPVFRN